MMKRKSTVDDVPLKDLMYFKREHGLSFEIPQCMFSVSYFVVC